VPIVEAKPNSKFARACRELAESIAGVRPSETWAPKSALARVPLLGRISA
jgi:MinD-like ATPase involved in chromosome partitioning or flagellar assembly